MLSDLPSSIWQKTNWYDRKALADVIACLEPLRYKLHRSTQINKKEHLANGFGLIQKIYERNMDMFQFSIEMEVDSVAWVALVHRDSIPITGTTDKTIYFRFHLHFNTFHWHTALLLSWTSLSNSANIRYNNSVVERYS